jgi:hypothetical protein
MIIFFNKKNGNIVGTIDGRTHSEENLKMWIGDKKETGRIVVQWKPVKWLDKNGEQAKKNSPDVVAIDFAPDTEYKQFFADIDRRKKNIYDYKVKLKNGEVIGFTKKS